MTVAAQFASCIRSAGAVVDMDRTLSLVVFTRMNRSVSIGMCSSVASESGAR